MERGKWTLSSFHFQLSLYHLLIKPSLVIAGLGNPGPSYAATRHNAGFVALDLLSAEFGQGEWKEDRKFLSLTQEARIGTLPVLLVKPLTYMNRSGEALRKIVDFYKLTPATQLMVLCDDLDVNLGEVRLRMKGGPGTHNGLRSVMEYFGEDYIRLRIGVGPRPAGGDLAAWVLSVPPAEERTILEEAVKGIPARIREYVLEGANGE